MNIRTLASACAASCAIALCSGCHDDATAAAPVSLADVRSAGQHEVEEARRRASAAYVEASRAVEEARRQAHRATIEGEREIARAQAKADHAVGMKACELLTHDARISCIAKVSKQYQRALVDAERIEYAYLD